MRHITFPVDGISSDFVSTSDDAAVDVIIETSFQKSNIFPKNSNQELSKSGVFAMFVFCICFKNHLSLKYFSPVSTAIT